MRRTLVRCFLRLAINSQFPTWFSLSFEKRDEHFFVSCFELLSHVLGTLFFNFYNQFLRYRCKHRCGKSAQTILLHWQLRDAQGRGTGVCYQKSAFSDAFPYCSPRNLPRGSLEVVFKYLLPSIAFFSCSYSFPFLSLHKFLNIPKSL